jgi:hypothetical protein
MNVNMTVDIINFHRNNVIGEGSDLAADPAGG